MKKALIISDMDIIFYSSAGSGSEKPDATINSTLSGQVIDSKSRLPLWLPWYILKAQRTK